MADLRPQYNEEAVGASHPTKADVINRAYNVEHDEDGTHGNITTTLNLTSGQIAFPATAVPSADANTLDDYEEGYYTPTITCTVSGGYTLDGNIDTLAYTKVGRVVHIQGQLTVTGEDAPDGILLISLPFAAATLSERAGYPVGSALLVLHGGNIPNNVVARVPGNGTTTFRLYTVADDGTVADVTSGGVDAAWILLVGFSYIAA